MLKEKNKTIKVVIRSSDLLMFDDEVRAVSSIDEKGRFDILPMHANFISVIKEKIIIHEIEGRKKEFTINTGILRATDNTVEIFLGIGSESEVIQA